jgi:hypothetical protein
MKTKILQPFENYSEKQLLFFGMIFLAIGSYLGWKFNTRFDGVLDLHLADKSLPLQTLIDLLISILCASVFLYVFGLSFNKKTRYIDLLITCLIAKIPLYFLPFTNFNNYLSTITNKLLDSIQNPSKINLEPNEILILMTTSIFTLIGLILSVVLLVNGYKTATNAKTTKHFLLFAFALLISEIASKILIYLFN